MDKQVIEPYNEYDCSKEEFTSDICSNMDSSQNNVEWKKPDKKEYILYDLIYIISQKRKLTCDSKQIVGAWERQKRSQKHIRKP